MDGWMRGRWRDGWLDGWLAGWTDEYIGGGRGWRPQPCPKVVMVQVRGAEGLTHKGVG